MLQNKTIASVPKQKSQEGSFFSNKATEKKGDSFFQPRLAIGPVDDPFEREADAVADKVVSMTNEQVQRQPSPVVVQPKCARCEDEEDLQRKEEDEDGNNEPVTSLVTDTLSSSGKSLDGNTRSFMEDRFGYDFSQVNIHTDSVAARSAESINALAYTSGNDIVFNTNQYAPATESGKRLLAHELTHVVQQQHGIQKKQVIQRQPLTQAQRNQQCYDPSVPQPNPSAREPELHPTYASWIGSFTGMTTFQTNDTAPGHTARNRFRALGTEGANYDDTTATSETESVPVTGTARPGEEFIDHPTNQWVVNCLPANLRATAYQLPSDCADIAVILRHVWLSAHHRAETYNGWDVGDRAGLANQPRAQQLIDDVYSGNVSAMVNAYADAQGHNLMTFNALQHTLHVGDVLVWEHRDVERNGTRIRSRRSGGHTQTISNIVRSGDTIVDIEVLQGNLPIFGDAASAILTARGARNTDPDSPAAEVLRDLPGRRIEVSSAISTADIIHPVSQQAIWGAIDSVNSAHEVTSFTVLVAAGPPRAARRPPSGRGGRRITDWRPRLQRASRASMFGVLEATLQEARSIIEQGASFANQVTTTDMASLGQDYGARIHALQNRNVTDLMRNVQEMVTIIRSLRDDSNNIAATVPMFNAFEQAFVSGALPQSTVEERRLFTEHSDLNNSLLPFASRITALTTAFVATRNMRQASAVAAQQGTLLWQEATTRAQVTIGGDNDDRPLYWSRLHMIEILRQGRPAFRITAADRLRLVEVFESASRGVPAPAGTSAFPSSATGKRILVSGFDPFDLDRTVMDSNPSGAAVLALDGQAVFANTISAHIEGVIFPVRYRDFDQGIIENFFTPYLDGTHAVNMIMTISQGSVNFDIEQWAGRRRSATLPDNEGVVSGGSAHHPVEPPGLAAGREFLDTRLPHVEMSQVPRTGLNSTGRLVEQGTGNAITGTGGGFLSNEIFYRTRLLQETISGGNPNPIRLGHLHVPATMPRQDIITRIRAILEASLTAI